MKYKYIKRHVFYKGHRTKTLKLSATQTWLDPQEDATVAGVVTGDWVGGMTLMAVVFTLRRR